MSDSEKAALNLCARHLADLRNSGLTDETIASSGIYTEESLDVLKDKFGFKAYKKGMGSAMVIPFRTADGGDADFHRIKPTTPRKIGKSNKPAKYESPPGRGNRIYFPLGVSDTLRDSSRPLFIVEGEKKALATTQANRPALGLIGVFGWKNPDAGKTDSLIQDLAAIAWENRPVFIIFDSDRLLNPNVLDAEYRLASCLMSSGAIVKIVELSNLPDGSKAGVDDFIVDFGLDALRRRIDEAIVPVAPNVADPFVRLESVLDEGPEFFFRETALLKALAIEALDDKASYAAHREMLRSNKVKIRDFDRVMGPLIQEEAKSRQSTLARDDTGGFFVRGGVLAREKMTSDGPLTIPLCNFDARIVDETTRDDGAEVLIVFGIEVTLANGRKIPRFEVPASKFNDPSEWLHQNCGSDAIIWPGESRAMAAAVQSVSQDPKTKNRRTVHTHTGWRKVGENWVYLHGGGCVSAAAPKPKVSVELSTPLDKYTLEEDDNIEDLRQAIKASLLVLKVAPLSITLPVLAAVYRAPFGNCDFSVFLAGLTGTGKSEIAALAQQHWGGEMDARHLPGSWTSTANANEGLAFLAKDAVIVIDDFCPTGNAGEISRLHRDADRLLRAQGNAAGRGRMKADGSARATKYPRGLIIATGEDIPHGHSLRARLCIREVGPGDVDWPQMTKRQADARNNLYSRSMAGFVRYLSQNFEIQQQRRKTFTAEKRSQLESLGSHARVPGLIAELMFGWRSFLAFALSAGAITEAERDEYREVGERTLVEAGASQSAHQVASNPLLNFFEILRSALSSGVAHVSNPDGDHPESADAWGWRFSGSATGEWQPQGNRVGWLEEGNLYLDPHAAYSTVQKLAAAQGHPIPLSQPTFWKRAKDNVPSPLQSHDEKRQRTTIRRRFAGIDQTVVHVRMDVFLDPSSILDGRTVQLDGRTDSTVQQTTPQNLHSMSKNGSPNGRIGLLDGAEYI